MEDPAAESVTSGSIAQWLFVLWILNDFGVMPVAVLYEQNARVLA